MHTIPELLDIAKKRNEFTSDRALAKALDIPNMHLYRQGRSVPSDATALRLADLCGLPAEQVLITCHLAKAESGEVMNAWKRVLKMAANACLVLVTLATVLPAPAPAMAGPAVHSQTNDNIHYATLPELLMQAICKLIRRLCPFWTISKN